MSSPYLDTPQKGFYLDLWQPVEITLSDLDKFVTIDNKFHKRPDLFAYEQYGNAKLFWVFLQANKDLLEDPIEDFVAGMRIRVPLQRNIGV